VLTASKQRFLWGASRSMRPSRFLREIPTSYLQTIQKGVRSVDKGWQEDADEDGFQPGDTVLHNDFGAGIVHKVYQTSLGLTYDVFFPRANTTRTLVAKYAKLVGID